MPTPSAVARKMVPTPAAPPRRSPKSKSASSNLRCLFVMQPPIAAAGRRGVSVAGSGPWPGAGISKHTNRSEGGRKHLAFHRALPKNAPQAPGRPAGTLRPAYPGRPPAGSAAAGKRLKADLDYPESAGRWAGAGAAAGAPAEHGIGTSEARGHP